MNFAITEESFVEFCLIDMNVIIIQFPCVILHDRGPSGFNQVSAKGKISYGVQKVQMQSPEIFTALKL